MKFRVIMKTFAKVSISDSDIQVFIVSYINSTENILPYIIPLQQHKSNSSRKYSRVHLYYGYSHWEVPWSIDSSSNSGDIFHLFGANY